MKVDGLGPSVAPGPNQNVAGSSAAQAPPQKVKPGNWASPAGSSTLTRKTTDGPNKQAKALVRWAIKGSKHEPGASLPTKLVDAFRDATPDFREAMRGDRDYKKFVREWASNLAGDAWNAPRTTIHRGDQAMRELRCVATACPPELAADLVFGATPVFVNYSKGNGAIFSSNDRVPVSKPSPEVEASKLTPDVEASKSSPDREASVPEFKKYTYLDEV